MDQLGDTFAGRGLFPGALEMMVTLPLTRRLALTRPEGFLFSIDIGLL